MSRKELNPSSGRMQGQEKSARRLHKKRLDSWKSIADYLERSTRTVQRWHSRHGLPVHHFRGPKGGAFAYPDEIDLWIAGSSLMTGEKEPRHDDFSNARERSLELTVIANRLWEIRSEKNIHSISGLYREAIEEDSENAAAFAGMANAMTFLGFHGMVEGSVAYPEAVEALNRTYCIDRDLPGRKCIVSWLDLCWNRKWGRARDGFNEILREGPRTSFALSGRALLHVAEGNLSEAWECAWEAWDRSPLAPPLSALLCWIAYLSGKYDKVLWQAGAARNSGGYGASLAAIEALAMIQNGSIVHDDDRFESLTFDYPQDRTLQAVLGYSYATSNITEKALKTLEQLGSVHDGWNHAKTAYGAALVLIGLGRRPEAVEALKASYEAGSRWSLGFRSDPMLMPLRGDRDFDDFLQRIGPVPATKGVKSVRELDAVAAATAVSTPRPSGGALARPWRDVRRFDGD